MNTSNRKWMILSVTSLGALLSALNFSTLIIALPDLITGLTYHCCKRCGLCSPIW